MSINVISDINGLGPSGDNNKALCQQFDTIKDNQTNATVCTQALDSVGNILKRCFDMNCTFTILDTRLDTDFFGFHIYPALRTLNNIAHELWSYDESPRQYDQYGDTSDKKSDILKELWQNNREWHIDIDAKLFFNPSIRFTPREIVALLFYEIEKRVFSFETMSVVVRAITNLLYKLDYRTFQIVKSKAATAFLVIPFLQACSYTSFNSEPAQESLMCLIPELGSDYRSAISKIGTKYTSDVINPIAADLVQKLSYTFSWMSEGLAGLKYTLHDIKKALEDAIRAEKSFYVKKILIDIYNLFCDYDRTGIIAEAHVPQVSPKYLEVKADTKMRNFRQALEAAADNSEAQLLDSLGRCKKVSQEEIDVLRIEVEKIESVDDKIYLLEKVYNKLAIINNALDLIGDKETKGRVRDSKDKLLKQKDELMEIRELLIAKKITPEHYGLYIKYPAGYEG